LFLILPLTPSFAKGGGRKKETRLLPFIKGDTGGFPKGREEEGRVPLLNTPCYNAKYYRR
jgi:hypothetical protein